MGIIGYRLGTIDLASSKSFVQIEYEKALDLNKDIFIYFIDEASGKLTPSNIDFGESHEKLQSFKSILRERHTIDTFSDENDLTEKLKRKFDEVLQSKIVEVKEKKDDYAKTSEILRKFLLMPKAYSSKEIKLKIKFQDEPFPASKSICKSFFLDYGKTLGIKIKILKPKSSDSAFEYLFLDSKNAEVLLSIDRSIELDIYATPRFSEDTIDSIRAHFESRTNSVFAPTTYLLAGLNPIIPPEGQIILQIKEFI